jgi:TldD protein
MAFYETTQESSMSDVLTLAEEQLLAPGGLDRDQLGRVLSDLMGPAVDSGDLYFQSSAHESWVLEDGLVRSGSHSVEQGVGIRAISGDKTGFAYADEIILPSLLQASGAARAIARDGRPGQVQAWRKQNPGALYGSSDPMESLDAAQKVDLLRQIDAYARSRDPRVNQVIVSLAATHETASLRNRKDGVNRAATAAVDVSPISIYSKTTAGGGWPTKRCARRWSTWKPRRRPPGP